MDKENLLGFGWRGLADRGFFPLSFPNENHPPNQTDSGEADGDEDFHGSSPGNESIVRRKSKEHTMGKACHHFSTGQSNTLFLCHFKNEAT